MTPSTFASFRSRRWLPRTREGVAVAAPSSRLPQLVSLLLALALLASSASLVQQQWVRRHATGPEEVPAAGSRAGSPTSDVVATIVSANLFGAAAAPVGDAPPADTQYELVGTIATGEPDSGFALLSERAGASRLIRAGGDLGQGILLAQVFWDHVVIRRGGRDEVLRLRKLQTEAEQPGRPPRHEGPIEPAARTEEEDAKFAPPPLPTAGAVTQALSLRNIVKNGRPTGLQVTGVNAAATAALATLGLQTGDVLVSPSSAGAVMRAVANGESIALTVQRNGSLLQVQLSPERAEAAAATYRAATHR